MRRVVVSLLVAGLVFASAPAAQAASRPSAPAARVAPTNGGVVISWSAAATNGAAITAYQVASRRYSASAKTWGSWSLVSLSSATRSKKVVASNGVLMQVRVRAVNRVGSGGWSSVLSQRAGVPGAVAGVKAVGGEQRVTVSWAAAPSNGDSITSYRVYRRSYTNSAWTAWTGVQVSAAARSAVVKGLVNGRTYEIYVVAVNRWGTGARGASLRAVPVNTAPGPVAGLVVESRTSSQIVLSWAVPDDPDLASIIVRRATGTVAPTTTQGGTGVPLAAGPLTSVTDLDLEWSRDYSYAVFVVDSSGKQSPARTISLATRPGAAVSFEVTGVFTDPQVIDQNAAVQPPMPLQLVRVVARDARGNVAAEYDGTVRSNIPNVIPDTTLTNGFGVFPVPFEAMDGFCTNGPNKTCELVGVHVSDVATPTIEGWQAGAGYQILILRPEVSVTTDSVAHPGCSSAPGGGCLVAQVPSCPAQLSFSSCYVEGTTSYVVVRLPSMNLALPPADPSNPLAGYVPNQTTVELLGTTPDGSAVKLEAITDFFVADGSAVSPGGSVSGSISVAPVGAQVTPVLTVSGGELLLPGLVYYNPWSSPEAPSPAASSGAQTLVNEIAQLVYLGTP